MAFSALRPILIALITPGCYAEEVYILPYAICVIPKVQCFHSHVDNMEAYHGLPPYDGTIGAASFVSPIIRLTVHLLSNVFQHIDRVPV